MSEQDKREDDVMRRMIATRPAPHPKAPSAKKPKPPKKAFTVTNTGVGYETPEEANSALMGRAVSHE